MKTKTLAIVFCVLFSFINARPSTDEKEIDKTLLTLTYEVVFIKDTTRPEKKTTDLMILDIGSKISKYYSYKQFKRDSIVKIDKENNASFDVQMLHIKQYRPGAFSHCIYKNYPSGQLTMHDKIVKDLFIMEEKLPDFNWHLTEQTDSICGYLCHIATGEFRGREYKAWFASEISKSEGPWKFCGLPGLILKIEDRAQQYIFECISINSKTQSRPITIDEAKRRKASAKELDKLYRSYSNDPLKYLKNSANISINKITNKDGEPMSNKDIKISYNPLELIF